MQAHSKSNVLPNLLASLRREKEGRQFSTQRRVIVLLAHLHCLPTTVALFVRLLEPDLGLQCGRIILVPKPYSTVAPVVSALQASGIHVIDEKILFETGHYDQAAADLLINGCDSAKSICKEIQSLGNKVRLILVDDGGILTDIWSRYFGDEDLEVVSVQQTTSGLSLLIKSSDIPKIDVARSAAKRKFESKIISIGVLRKIRTLGLLDATKSLGIIGMGAVGGALATELRNNGNKVFGFDDRKEEKWDTDVNRCDNVIQLIEEADVIFGCTGQNCLAETDISVLSELSPRTFISCSSRDIEFLRLLQLSSAIKDENGAFSRISIKMNGHLHFVENGGFPINFDRREEQESPDEIALTRGLVLSGILQAESLRIIADQKEVLMLSPYIQRQLVNQWLSLTGGRSEQFGVPRRDLANIDWWISNSEGKHHAEPYAWRIEPNRAPLYRRIMDWLGG